MFSTFQTFNNFHFLSNFHARFCSQRFFWTIFLVGTTIWINNTSFNQKNQQMYNQKNVLILWKNICYGYCCRLKFANKRGIFRSYGNMRSILKAQISKSADVEYREYRGFTPYSASNIIDPFSECIFKKYLIFFSFKRVRYIIVSNCDRYKVPIYKKVIRRFCVSLHLFILTIRLIFMILKFFVT